MYFSCPKRDADKLKILFDSYDVPVSIHHRQGLYLLFWRTAGRPGLYIGLVFFLFCLFFSTNFVFDVRIEGNETLTDQEVMAELEKQGFGIGSFLPKIDIEALCNRTVLKSDKISWISVNMLGTIACVQIREYRPPSYSEPETGLSTLVAARDGVIVGFDCSTGKIAVNVGETVKAGQVLVNGVTDTAIGTYFGNAAGAVRARTNRVFTVTIPKTEQITVGYTRKNEKKSIIFLGKTIKLFTKGGNLPSSCDTIKSERRRLSVFGDLLLPVFVETKYTAVPILQTVTHTKEEARRLANEELNRQLDALSDLSILSEKTIFQENKDGYTLTRELVCIENIAKKVPIEVN